MTKVRREPDSNLDWPAYDRRIGALRKLAGPAWSTRDTLTHRDPIIHSSPRLSHLTNWAPFSREDREWFRAEYGPSIFKGTTRIAVVAEFHETDLDPETGDQYFRLLVRPTVPDGEAAYLTVSVPVFDLGGWDITAVMGAVEDLVWGAIRECPTHEEAPGMLPAPEEVELYRWPEILGAPVGPVTYHIRVSGMRQEDVKWIMEEFRRELHDALEDGDLRTELLWRAPGRLKPTVPPERQWLLHGQQSVFEERLRRYTLWMHGRGFTVPQIAWIEEEEKRGGHLDLSKVPYTVGGKPIPRKIGSKPAEDNIRKAIELIFQAIYLEPSKEELPEGSVRENARERREHLPRTFPEYNCPKHGASCPPPRWDPEWKRWFGCPYQNKWADEAQLDLPKRWTGQSPREVHPETLDWLTEAERRMIGKIVTRDSPVSPNDRPTETVEVEPVAALPVGAPEPITTADEPQDVREIWRRLSHEEREFIDAWVVRRESKITGSVPTRGMVAFRTRLSPEVLGEIRDFRLKFLMRGPRR